MIKTAIALGGVQGTVQAINSRSSLRFTLYDLLFDEPVSCFIEKSQRHLLDGIWGKQVYVTGWITRNPYNGRAISIREITAIDILPPVQPGAFEAARGILEVPGEYEPAEVSIRRLRDAEG